MKPLNMFRRLQVILHLSELLLNYNSCMFIIFSFPKHLSKLNYYNTIFIVAKEKIRSIRIHNVSDISTSVVG